MRKLAITISLIFIVFSVGCNKLNSESSSKGRLVMFIGVDISGSFMKSKNFKDSLRFLSHYIYGHLHGQGGLEKPNSLFIGSIGGAKANESKTFYPIETFQDKSIVQIEKQLHKIFPRQKIGNPFTDYNAFFGQIQHFVESRKLVMRPISIVMLSDGIPDTPKKNGKHDYRSLKLKPLENLSRNVTLRLLYTDAVVGTNWQTRVPRQRVKVWTQDANVMRYWKARNIMLPGKEIAKQEKFYAWVKSNVDFNVRLKRVD